MQNPHPAAARSDRKGMFAEHNHQYASAEHMLTVMASKSAHPNNFHLGHSDMNPNNLRPGRAAAAAVDPTGGGGAGMERAGMEHMFPYDVHSCGNQTPAQMLPFNLFQIDHSNAKSNIRLKQQQQQQQQQKWIGESLHKAHARPVRPTYGLDLASILNAEEKKASAGTIVKPHMKPQPHPRSRAREQPKPALRDPKKAPRGCPAGHWWCKLCNKYMTLNHFNPSTKAMQYKYLCATCETKTKQDQAVKFKRGRDGNVNPKHPRRVGAQNKSKDEARQIRAGTFVMNGTKQPLKKRRRRGRQWGSVQKLVDSFDPNVDWRLVVLGMRNQTVHYASNFKSGKEFASQDLLIRFRHWVMLQDDGHIAHDSHIAHHHRGPQPDVGPKTVVRREPMAVTASSAKMNLLMQRIQNLGVQQRLVSQELDDCLCALVHLQRNQGVLSQEAMTRGAPVSANLPVSNPLPVAV